MSIEGYIYLTINWVNGMKYIGQHIDNGKPYYGSGIIIKKALKKYGRENFTKEILCSCYNQETLDYWEKHYMKKYNVKKSREYYNLYDEIGPPIEVTRRAVKASLDYTQRKVYELDENDNHINTYKSLSDVSRLFNVSPASIGINIKYNMKGIRRLCKERIFTYNVNIPTIRKPKFGSKEVIVIYKNNKKEIFPSMREVCRTLKVSRMTAKAISKRDYITPESPYILRYTKDIDISTIKCAPLETRTKSVTQYNLQGNKIKVWNSIMEVEKTLKIGNPAITACCKGRKWTKTAGGFIWKYTE